MTRFSPHTGERMIVRQIRHSRRRGRAKLATAALTMLLVACSDDAERLGPGPGAALPAPGGGSADYSRREAVVRLGPGTTIAEINQRYETWTLARVEGEPVYLLEPPAGQTVDDLLPAMRQDPDLAVAEPNYRLHNPEAQGSSMAFADPALESAEYVDQQALSRIRAKQAWSLARGKGVTVAILDTGLDLGHAELAGKSIKAGQDFVDGDTDPSDAPDGLDSDGDGLTDEGVGHGTFVTGLVLAVAPRASILPVRVLDSDGVGTSFAVARGIRFARNRGARVVNMSLGMDVKSDVMDELIERFKSEDIVFVASTGNHDREQPQQFPARDSHVIGVAATDRVDRKASFSNFGSWVDVSAPGVGLVSLFPGGFTTWSGTSFASAFTAGEAALLFSYRPSARFNHVVDAIEDSAVDIDGKNPYYDGELGEGRIHVRAAFDHLP